MQSRCVPRYMKTTTKEQGQDAGWQKLWKSNMGEEIRSFPKYQSKPGRKESANLNQLNSVHLRCHLIVFLFCFVLFLGSGTGDSPCITKDYPQLHFITYFVLQHCYTWWDQVLIKVFSPCLIIHPVASVLITRRWKRQWIALLVSIYKADIASTQSTRSVDLPWGKLDWSIIWCSQKRADNCREICDPQMFQ